MNHRRLCPAVLIAGLATTAAAQERQIQFRSVDFQTDVIEIFNFGPSDVDLSGWRFCSHDFDQARQYSASGGFNGVTIEAGSSIFIHYNNDAPVASDNFNIVDIGGNFATPLIPSAYGIQFYFPGSTGSVAFGDGSLISDHIQWNIDGANVGSSEFRTGLAVGQGLWSATGDFIATSLDTIRIDLTDLSGDEAGSPDEYAVTEPAPPCIPNFDDSNDALDFNDVVAFLTAFANGDPAADLDGNPGLDFNDVVEFLQLFAAGCP